MQQVGGRDGAEPLDGPAAAAVVVVVGRGPGVGEPCELLKQALGRGAAAAGLRRRLRRRRRPSAGHGECENLLAGCGKWPPVGPREAFDVRMGALGSMGS